MFPISILKVAPLVAAMRIVVATMPNGDIERAFFTETSDGVRVVTQHTNGTTRATDVAAQRFIPKGFYRWRITEERRTVLMAPEGGRTGVVRRAYAVAAWVDLSGRADAAPRPTEVLRFYAPDKESADALRDRLGKALRK